MYIKSICTLMINFYSYCRWCQYLYKQKVRSEFEAFFKLKNKSKLDRTSKFCILIKESK